MDIEQYKLLKEYYMTKELEKLNKKLINEVEKENKNHEILRKVPDAKIVEEINKEKEDKLK